MCNRPLRRNPFIAVQQVPDDVQSEDVVVVSEEDVEQKQLTDGVDAVQQFDEHVTACQVVAVQFAGDEDALTRQQLAKSWQTSGPLITACHQITIQQVNGEPSNSIYRSS